MFLMHILMLTQSLVYYIYYFWPRANCIITWRENKVRVLISLCPVPEKFRSAVLPSPVPGSYQVRVLRKKMLSLTFIMGFKECCTKECCTPVKEYGDTMIFISFQTSSYLSSLFFQYLCCSVETLQYSTVYENLEIVNTYCRL